MPPRARGDPAIELGGTHEGKMHLLHLIHDAPLCGSKDHVESRRVGTMREFTWDSRMCARCLQLAYLGLELEQQLGA